MTSLVVASQGFEPWLRWLVRLVAGGLVALVVVIFVGEGGVNPLALTPVEAAMLLCMAGAVAGLALGWRRPLLGGALALLAMTLFFAIDWLARGSLPRGIYFQLMWAAGLGFLVDGLLQRRAASAARFL